MGIISTGKWGEKSTEPISDEQSRACKILSGIWAGPHQGTEQNLCKVQERDDISNPFNATIWQDWSKDVG